MAIRAGLAFDRDGNLVPPLKSAGMPYAMWVEQIDHWLTVLGTSLADLHVSENTLRMAFDDDTPPLGVVATIVEVATDLIDEDDDQGCGVCPACLARKALKRKLH